VYIDAQKLAEAAGNVVTVNAVLLGAYIKKSGLFTPALMKSVLRDKFAQKADINVKAFDAGYAV
jgi:Pyruvate/2-oxoacid:ferredoxin oxidoreductase gamma subunit